MPAEKLPVDSDLIKYLKIPSRLLSDFHGRPIYLRAGVILPRSFAREPDRSYPLLVHVGGYASRFSEVGQMMSPGSSFHSDWMAEDCPEMILVHLDGAGPARRSVPGRLGQSWALRRGGDSRADTLRRAAFSRHWPAPRPLP